MNSNLKLSKNRPASIILDKAVSLYPEMSTSALARMLFKRHPKVWKSEEHVNVSIRYRRGAQGNRARNRSGATQAKATPASKFNPLNPLGLPESSAHDVTAVKVDGVSHALIIGDLHLPYHNMAALTAALQEGVRRKPDCVLINGDMMDMHTLSRFQKDPEARSFKEERATAKAFLVRLRELFPDARIIYKKGNHEDRVESYILPRAPEFYDASIFDLTALLGLDAIGVELVDQKRELTLGKLTILHGHELPKGMTNSVNPARGAFLRTTATVLVHHHHRTSEHVERTMDGRIIGCWSSGCLCQLRPLFEPNNKWNHGFAFVEVAPSGDFNLQNMKIHNGRVL